MNQIPERLIGFRAYKDGSELVGMVDVELPVLEAMSDTISGAGIAGEVETPTMGQFGAMGITINWRTVTKPGLQLAAQKWHALEFRGAVQLHDAGTGTLRPMPIRVAVRAMPKNISLGTLAVAAAMDASHEFEVSYIRVDIDGSKAMELDKFNYVFDPDGNGDVLAAVRKAMGGA